MRPTSAVATPAKASASAATAAWRVVREASTPPTSTPSAFISSRPVSAHIGEGVGRAVKRAERDHEKVLSPPMSEIRIKKPRLSRIGGESRSRQLDVIAERIGAARSPGNRATLFSKPIGGGAGAERSAAPAPRIRGWRRR